MSEQEILDAIDKLAFVDEEGHGKLVQIYPETAQACCCVLFASTNLPRDRAISLLCSLCWYQSTPKLHIRCAVCSVQ